MKCRRQPVLDHAPCVRKEVAEPGLQRGETPRATPDLDDDRPAPESFGDVSAVPHTVQPVLGRVQFDHWHGPFAALRADLFCHDRPAIKPARTRPSIAKKPGSGAALVKVVDPSLKSPSETRK